MTMHPEQWRSATRTALDEYVDQVRFARAVQLAHSGKHLEAQGVLCVNGQIPEIPRDLDLLARIAVCQGHLSEARRLWELALSKEPQNSTYQECLQRLGELPRIRISFDTALTCSIWGTNMLGIATLVYVFLLRK